MKQVKMQASRSPDFEWDLCGSRNVLCASCNAAFFLDLYRTVQSQVYDRKALTARPHNDSRLRTSQE